MKMQVGARACRAVASRAGLRLGPFDEAAQIIGRVPASKVMRENLTIGFNSRNYDIPIIVAAASGLNNADLKKLSDQIILEDKPGWSLGYSIPDRWDHIDIIELAIGQSSLKIYGGRLGAPKMQDLPIEPDATITPEQREIGAFRRALREQAYDAVIETQGLLKTAVEIGRAHV